jgi:hypothetical protein
VACGMAMAWAFAASGENRSVISAGLAGLVSFTRLLCRLPGVISTRGVAKVNFLSIAQNGRRMCA